MLRDRQNFMIPWTMREIFGLSTWCLWKKPSHWNAKYWRYEIWSFGWSDLNFVLFLIQSATGFFPFVVVFFNNNYYKISLTTNMWIFEWSVFCGYSYRFDAGNLSSIRIIGNDPRSCRCSLSKTQCKWNSILSLQYIHLIWFHPATR